MNSVTASAVTCLRRRLIRRRRAARTLCVSGELIDQNLGFGDWVLI